MQAAPQGDGGTLPVAKDPKKLEKEAAAAAAKAEKDAKFKAKQAKLAEAAAAKATSKPNVKKEKEVKPKAVEIESKSLLVILYHSFKTIMHVFVCFVFFSQKFRKFLLVRRKTSQVPCQKGTTLDMLKHVGTRGGRKMGFSNQSIKYATLEKMIHIEC